MPPGAQCVAELSQHRVELGRRELARARGVSVRAILLTHTDIDHIAGVHELREPTLRPVERGAAAVEDPTLVHELTNGGTQVVVDTQAFRYADARTWLSPKWSQVPFAPAVPFDGSRQWVDEFVASDLRFQSAVGGSAYLLPAWFTARTGARPSS